MSLEDFHVRLSEIFGRPLFYMLEKDGTVRPAEGSDLPGPEVITQEHAGELWISTVFMGMDLQPFAVGTPPFVDGKPRALPAPLLFETMAFTRAREVERCARYSSLVAALAGHIEMVEWARGQR